MQNPFTLTFGKNPLEAVDSPIQINEILSAFTSDPINHQMFLLTGIRGSGKTVKSGKYQAVSGRYRIARRCYYRE